MDSASTVILRLAVASTLVLLLPGGIVARLDFFLLPNLTKPAEGKILCQEHGFDGLAALSTPEAYYQALETTAYIRLTYNWGIDVGLYFNATSKVMTWADGTEATPDLPWWYAAGEPNIGKRDKVGRIYWEGPLMLYRGSQFLRPSLCGNYHKTEAQFSIFRDMEPQTFENATLRVFAETSYISCSTQCGYENVCRGAVFKSDASLCKLFNPNLPLNIDFVNNPMATTYVRKRYPVY